MTFTVVIPARFASERLPGKPLMDIGGKPMIQRVYEQALLSEASQVIVATDDNRIVKAVQAFGGEVCLTRKDHPSGTDRIHEVAAQYGFDSSHIIVNVQGDEPMIPPQVINQVANNIIETGSPAATLCEAIKTIEDLLDPNIVKVVTDTHDHAMYFSRAPIPYDRDSMPEKLGYSDHGAKRHVGIYAYRVSLLNDFVSWPTDDLELTERLEQLRILRRGIHIHVAKAVEAIPGGVDTPEDLEKVRALVG